MESTQEKEEMVTTERVAITLLELVKGRPLSTAQIADLTGLTMNGAWMMMSKISRVAPVHQQDGLWILLVIHK